MFDRIAPRYDLLNTILSLGRDRRWRSLTAEAATERGAQSLLDVATGSGKLAAELLKRSHWVVGADFSLEMLNLARRTEPRLELVLADARHLPFPDESFDAATIGFGLRNMESPEQVLTEIRRIVRVKGVLGLLEFTRPPDAALFAPLRFYLNEVLPRVGGCVSGDETAYRHLSTSIAGYYTRAELATLVESAGWRELRSRGLNFGTVALISARH